MAWEEWEQLKAETPDRSSTAMQLNRVPDERDPGGGPPGGDLKVSQQDLAAVGDAIDHVQDR
ncbi:hypothetical protein ACIQRS_21350 [Streptomyces termitum]|uniref:Uncharacterized protein n=1 Tax=Streptomyces termitum TaxID=67368 RepID=A0A918T4L9_9ACTN|nr:hypothetical protein GCM10010305_33360 [Streptomyces termitum]